MAAAMRGEPQPGYQRTAGLHQCILQAREAHQLRTILLQHHHQLLQTGSAGDLDAVNLSSLASCLVKLLERSGSSSTTTSQNFKVAELLQPLIDISAALMDSMKSRPLSSIMWALARLAHMAPHSDLTTTRPAATDPAAGPHTNTSSTTVGLMEALFHDMLSRLVSPHVLARASPQDITQALHAHARMGFVPHQDHTHALLGAMQERMYRYFGPQDFSMAAYALGALRLAPSPGWLRDFAAATRPKLHAFTSQVCMCVTVCVWGCMHS